MTNPDAEPGLEAGWYDSDMVPDRRVEGRLLWKELLVWVLVGLVAFAHVYWVG